MAVWPEFPGLAWPECVGKDGACHKHQTDSWRFFLFLPERGGVTDAFILDVGPLMRPGS